MDKQEKWLKNNEWTVICDFDGTITPFDVTDAVLEKFALPEWEVLEKDWLDGKIPARDCMEKQIALIRATQTELDDFLDTVPVVKGFFEFSAFCKQHALKILVVSNGMDYGIKRVLARHGLAELPVIANHLRSKNGNYTLESPFAEDSCAWGVCKCKIAKSEGRKSFLIGDSHSDFCLSGNADFVLAKKGEKLEQHCIKNTYTHNTFNDFFDVIAFFERALAI